MCSLIVLLGADPEFPIVVAANRDEQRARPSSPPGLFVGVRRRILSPRDQRAGGTWMGINDKLWFAGLTNAAPGTSMAGAPSRGSLPHLALDQASFDDVAPALRAEVRARAFHPFRLLVTDGDRTLLFAYEGGDLRSVDARSVTLTLTNEHAPQELRVPGLDAVRQAGLTVDERLDRLASVLLDQGALSGHRILKTGGDYGTVSSSLLAIPRSDPRRLVWRYAPGAPDATPYRNYGNLGRRLLEA